MAVSRKPLIFCVLVAFTFTKIVSEPPRHGDGSFAPEDQEEDHSLEGILDQLKSKISFLVSSNDERTNQLRSQDDRIRLMEKIIEEKSRSISLLQSEKESRQPEGSVDTKEQTRLVHIRVAELEKQVDKLRKEIELQSEKKNALEVRAYVAEKKIQEVNEKLKELQEINKEQNIRLGKTQHELQLALEDVMNAKLGIDSVTSKFVKGEWLPNWLAIHFEHFQHYTATLWNKCGRDDLEVTLQKVLEKTAQVGNWVEHHIKILVAKWMPKLKEQVLNSVTDPEVRIRSLIMKMVELYHGSKSYVIHHIVCVQKLVYPYINETKKFAEPYVSQVATVMRPQCDKVCVVLKLCTIKIDETFKDFIKVASSYHHQVQCMLKDNELTRPLATMELAWFLAAALWTLPLIMVFRLYSALFSRSVKKQNHGSHNCLSRRRTSSHHRT